jgi:hypothetical protein
MPDINERPIIGILTNNIQDSKEMEEWGRSQGFNSYIGRNYVQSVEGAGARVVPIVYD